MLTSVQAGGARLRTLAGRLFSRLGLREDNFLAILAIFIGIVTAAAAVGFHDLIQITRTSLYGSVSADILYGKGILLLVAFPAIGGLAVGLVSRFIFRAREGHGIIDVMEAVVRSSGVVKPISAVEKIITAAMTIGTGGSAGAEGPIVQIGAGIASGFGQLFAIPRQHIPVLIGCGCAAGISAIFNSPIGGVFFALEIILLDFSLRTFTPVVLASVIANVTTKAIFGLRHEAYEAIFAMPQWEVTSQAELVWSHLGFFAILGVLCGIVGVTTTLSMHRTEHWFSSLRVPRWFRPAVGGAMVGVLGVVYILAMGRGLLGKPKPIDFADYPLPAFYSDGYGVVRQLVRSGPGEVSSHGVGPAAIPAPGADGARTTEASPSIYNQHSGKVLLILLGSLCLLKIVATCFTLSSGGSGGIIAPSLFLGATAGGFLGVVLQKAGYDVHPNLYALVGMGAVLAAVVHAPIASILILLELTQDYKIILPAMLATVIAAGVARLIFRDSVYTVALRARGVRVGTLADLSLLRRMTIEQVELEPATIVGVDEPLQSVLEMTEQTGVSNFVVVDERKRYCGMIVAEDIKTALLQRDAVPLLVCGDILRPEVPLVTVNTDLLSALDLFSLHDVDDLPVTVSKGSGRVIGLIGRAGLMRRYQHALAEGM